jgi:hypothetical protein
MGDLSKNLRKGSSFQDKPPWDERWAATFLNLPDVLFRLILNTSISMGHKHIKEYRLLGIDSSLFYALAFKNVWNKI